MGSGPLPGIAVFTPLDTPVTSSALA